MRIIRSALVALSLFGVGTTGTQAQDVAEGEALAKEWCVRCHNVEPGGAFKLQPPSFAAIAVYRSPDQIYGRIAFPVLHSSMPQIAYVLSPENIDALVAYIVSLEKQ